MVFFPTHDVEIFEEVVDAEICGVDGYGNAKKCLTTIGKCRGNFQPLSNAENMAVYGSVSSGAAVLFLPPSVKISSKSKVRINDDDFLYEVNGRPAKRTAFFPRIKVNLIPESS